MNSNKEYFKGINKIPFEGKESDNPLASSFMIQRELLLEKN
tara:strand:+ start:159 stop:281 length:123 start_codon:yes stop_codon:yes gene_type:complete